MYIAIIGGGPAGQAAALNLMESGDNTVVIFRRGDHDRLKTPILTMQDSHGKEVTSSPIPTIYYTTDDPLGHELPQADVILLCTPVHAYGAVLKLIEPFISRNKPVHVGTIYGQGFFNMVCKRENGIFSKLPNVETFSMAFIPWIVKCPTSHSVRVASEEHFNLIYTTTKDVSLVRDILEQLTFNNKLKPVLKFTKTELETTLAADNWLLHTPRLWDLLNNTNQNQPVVPTFYGDYTDRGIDCLEKITHEYENLRSALKFHCESVGTSLPDLLSFKEMEELPDSTGHSEPFIGYREYFADNTTPNHKAPHILKQDGWVVNMHHRMFPDDVLNGLQIIIALCKLLHVDCINIVTLNDSLMDSMRDVPAYSNLDLYTIIDWSKVSLDDYLMGL
jgi:hypothetical protein